MAPPAPLRHLWGTALAGGLIAGLAPIAAAQGAGGHAQPAQTYGEPADIITAEMGLGRTMREKGESAALRAAAAPDAQIFTRNTLATNTGPTAVLRIDAYAKTRANSAPTPHRDPQAVWMACDGSVAVARGVWNGADGQASAGTYVTVWQRQKHGDYKWVLDLADVGPASQISGQQNASDMIAATVADCPARHRPRITDAPAPKPDKVPAADSRNHKDGPPDYLAGESSDHTLAWTGAVSADGGVSFTLRLKQNGQMNEVLRIPPASGSGG